MRERVLRIGKPTPLTGVVSVPDKFDAQKPAVLIHNSGVMHHIGTCRLSVKLGRALAEAGLLAFRFDFSGIGDSAPRSGTLSFTESAPMEVAEVMDFFQKTKGIDKFIVYGLCSGADASYETAKLDSRVVGLCQIDPYCYRNLGWHLHYWLPRLLSPARWINFIKTRFISPEPTPEAAVKEVGEENVELPTYIREFPPQEDVARHLQDIVDRNIPIYNIFTNGQNEILNHASQYADSFRNVNFRGLLSTDYFPETRHIITEPPYQKLVVDKIVQWALDSVVPRATAASDSGSQETDNATASAPVRSVA